MKTIETIHDLRNLVASAGLEGKSIGLVPTMGFFHEGHLALMRRAKEENDLVIVSIFVNPMQFGPQEDFDRYPRDIERDTRMAESVGIHAIFTPSVGEMYPKGFASSVEVEKLGDNLCGASRPGHFRGVATVVLKLLNQAQSDKAYFGLKDYQQFKIIERMVNDLNVPVEIIPVPIVREPDGLAMSSRNAYLSPDERQAALVLSKALDYAQRLVDDGVTTASDVTREVETFMRQEPLAWIEYVSLVDSQTLECLGTISNEALLALAVRIGPIRLIDNAILKVSSMI